MKRKKVTLEIRPKSEPVRERQQEPAFSSFFEMTGDRENQEEDEGGEDWRRDSGTMGFRFLQNVKLLSSLETMGTSTHQSGHSDPRNTWESYFNGPRISDSTDRNPEADEKLLKYM